jgi:hypothetical protein
MSWLGPRLEIFMKKLESLRPQENKGRGDSYVLCALRTHIDQVHADESQIFVKSGELEVMIRREELDELIGEKLGVAAIDADKEKIVLVFDADRLPKRADGSSVLV